MELEDYLVSNENGPYQEYFYIDLPENTTTTTKTESEAKTEEDEIEVVSSPEKRRRFVYVKIDNNVRFPMSFGNEVS
jgi:hypothetical protein